MPGKQSVQQILIDLSACRKAAICVVGGTEMQTCPIIKEGITWAAVKTTDCILCLENGDITDAANIANDAGFIRNSKLYCMKGANEGGALAACGNISATEISHYID